MKKMLFVLILSNFYFVSKAAMSNFAREVNNLNSRQDSSQASLAQRVTSDAQQQQQAPQTSQSVPQNMQSQKPTKSTELRINRALGYLKPQEKAAVRESRKAMRQINLEKIALDYINYLRFESGKFINLDDFRNFQKEGLVQKDIDSIKDMIKDFYLDRQVLFLFLRSLSL